MPTVRFTRHLKRFFPDLEEVEVQATNVCEVIDALEGRFEGMRGYVLDDAGAVRKHVNIFINNDMIKDRQGLSDAVTSDDEVFIMQALSGG